MATTTIYTGLLDAGLISGPESAYATARTQANADSITAQATGHKVGQAKEGASGYYVYRVCLIFDCTTAAGLTASTGKITLYESSSSINDAQSMYLIDPAGDVADSGVVVADFGDLLGNTTSWGSITNTDWAGPGDKDITLNTAGLAALQTAMDASGLLKLALRSGHDIANTPDTGFIERNYFLFEGPADTTEVRRPRLVITSTTLAVTTQTCQDVVGATATGRGNITVLDGTVSAHGHCWNTTTNPTTSNSFVDNGAASSTGAFTSAITGLTPGTGYYTRAYATNEVTTVYGANVYFVASKGRAGYIWMEGSNLHGFDENAVERQYIHTDDVDDTPVDAATTDPISSNWAYDHVAAADPHTGYVLESLFDAQTILQATSDNTPIALTLTEQTLVGRLTGANITAVALGISDNNVAQIDGTSNTPANLDYAKFTTSGLEGKSYQELVNDISGVIKATDVEVSELSTATYDDVQDYMNFFGHRTLLSGGAITDNGNGTVAIASLTGWCSISDSETAVGKFFDWAGGNTPSLTDMTTNYIYLDYNGGTLQLVVSTSILTHGFKLDHIHVGTAFRDGTETHFHKPTNFELDLGAKVDMHHQEETFVHRVDGLITTETGTRNLSITAGVSYEGLNRHTSLPFDTSRSGTADFNEVNKLHDADGDFSVNDVGKSVHNTTDNTYGTITAFVDSGELTLAGDTFPDGNEAYNIDFWTYHYYDGDLGTPAWVEVHGATQISNSQYNDVDTGLANFTANRYGVSWVFMEIDGLHLHVVYGQGDYKINEAEEAGVPSFLPNIVTNYCALIAKIILRQGQTTMTITYPWTTVFTSSLATDHGSLGGLGHDDHTQYLLLTGGTLTGDLDIGANLLKTTNLAIKELNSTTLAIRNAVDDAYRDLILGQLQFSTLTGNGIGSTVTIQTRAVDSTSILLKARDNDGDVYAEVARLQSANDPYFQATLPLVLNPIATASLPATPVEGMFTYNATLDLLTYRDASAWKTVEITGHKAKHEDTGTDEISIAGLAGESAELATHKANTTTVHGAVSAATASKHVVRDASARAKFAQAAAAGDAIVADANVRAPDSTLLEGSSKATVQDHTPKAHTLDSHSNPTGSVEFNQQQALQLVIENRTSDPGSPVEGQTWIRTDLD